MTALSHIQHAQLSAFSFISERGRVRERSLPGVGISLLTIPHRVDHTEKKNRTGIPPFRCMHVSDIMNVAAITGII